MQQDTQPGPEFSRRIYDGVIGWYHNADNKAQVMLTLDGAFLAFLTNTVFIEPEKLRGLIQNFAWETWVLLAIMALCLAGSITCAILCLWSRLNYSNSHIRNNKSAPDAPLNHTSIVAQDLIFFQSISKLPTAALEAILQGAGNPVEISAIARQLPVLSRNVTNKHLWVNRGFLLAAASLLSLLLAAASYMLHLH